jgi:hypothetical protein
MRNLLVLVFFFLSFSLVKADKILNDLELNSGEWVMVGVPIHNYQLMPIQQELGTFICKDVSFMREIQKQWDFEYTNEDKCDYHYAIKFYHNKQIVKTITLNLHCGYVTNDGLSYTFDPTIFNRFKQVSKPVDWSRISFEDDAVLKKAIKTLSVTNDVLWYEDVQPYQYKGYFTMSYSRLPWDVDLDSLHKEVENEVKSKTGNKEFYVQLKGYSVENDNMYVSFQVNCNEELAKKANKIPATATKWKAHLEKGQKLYVVAIGLNETKYRKLMGLK